MPRRAAALLVALVLSAFAATPASAQARRFFPANALRGSIAFGIAPEIALNGNPARLAPGSRVRDAQNMLAMPGALMGGKLLVHYTLDSYGLVKDVWVLTPAEAARRPWPETPEQAERWVFDPGLQVWSRP